MFGHAPVKQQPEPPRWYYPASFVGEAPNAQGLDKYDTQSGKRLKRMLGGKELPWWNIHGALPPRWSVRVARERVRQHLVMFPDRSEVLFLLGRRVADAFDIPKNVEWLDWLACPWHEHTMILFPHPSPQNRWWNDAENTRHAEELLRSVALGDLPRYEKGVKS
jgi:hypothetical protein